MLSIGIQAHWISSYPQMLKIRILEYDKMELRELRGSRVQEGPLGDEAT